MMTVAKDYAHHYHQLQLNFVRGTSVSYRALPFCDITITATTTMATTSYIYINCVSFNNDNSNNNNNRQPHNRSSTV